MGSTDDDKDARSDEKPEREVRISRPFYLGVFEVTQAQYRDVTGQNPSYFASTGDGKNAIAGQLTDQHPVEMVSWLDAVRFCNTLSEREGLKPFYEIDGDNVQVPNWDGTGYRLPTEAEWEYTCRAGSRTSYSFGDDVKGHAWLADNSGRELWDSGRFWIEINNDSSKYLDGIQRRGCCTHPVGQKIANGFGLYDMHGNVWEWCWDWYDAECYKQMLNNTPTGPPAGTDRVLRGGSFSNGPANLRSAVRFRSVPANRYRDLGFRLARTYH
jgi:formylglycine-generating enzyme required for sulfatase activity